MTTPVLMQRENLAWQTLIHPCTTIIEEASRRTRHHSPRPVRAPKTGNEVRWEQPLGSTTGAASGAVVRLRACTYSGWSEPRLLGCGITPQRRRRCTRPPSEIRSAM